MGIDRLSKAARAAGYAMATSEDLLTAPAPRKTAEQHPWRAAEPKPMPKIAKSTSIMASITDWRKSVYGLFGWGATA